MTSETFIADLLTSEFKQLRAKGQIVGGDAEFEIALAVRKLLRDFVQMAFEASADQLKIRLETGEQQHRPKGEALLILEATIASIQHLDANTILSEKAHRDFIRKRRGQ